MMMPADFFAPVPFYEDNSEPDSGSVSEDPAVSELWNPTGAITDQGWSPTPNPVPGPVPEPETNYSGVTVPEREAFGYNRGMRSEIEVAVRWGAPLTDYMTTMKAAKLSKGTIYLRGWQLRTLSQYFHDRSPWELTRSDLVEFMASREHAGLAHIRSFRSTIRGFYAWGHAEGQIPTNPAFGLPKVKAPQGRPRPADAGDIRAAVMAASASTRLMIYLGADVGLRAAEIARVHVDDLGHDASGWILTVTGKGGKVRTFPIRPKIAGLIMAAGEQFGWAFPSLHTGREDLYRGTHVTPNTVTVRVSQALPPGVTCHMLRHRFASDMYVATGHDIRAVQESLGHSSVATTQIYTEVPRDSLRKALDSMPDY